MRNQDKVQSYNKKRARKDLLEKIAVAQQSKSNFTLRSNISVAVSRRREIIKLHSKGKDTGSIAVWMNLPMSVVQSVIEKHTTPQTQP